MKKFLTGISAYLRNPHVQTKATILISILFLISLGGCTISEYHAAPDYNTHENIIFFDLNAEGIGVHNNGVFLPPCIPASNITCLEILQMLPYAEFVPSDNVFVNPGKVSGEPVLLIEMLDTAGSRVGLMATHSPIIGLEGAGCIAISLSGPFRRGRQYP